ncbi:MAG: DUF177 domain-containing protein [Candidatus Rokubacteria bacterium]|nr:DUF177 domain-containing protein [Candidatus Rokubacteria bacterium]
MIIRVSDIQAEGLSITDEAAVLPAFTEEGWHLDRISLHLTRDGVDVLVQGEIGATVPQVCGRCVEPLQARVRAEVDVRVAPRPATGDTVELAPDDLDTYFYAGDQLHLSALIETETTLALPMKPLCRADCRGLCPVCGGNRNVSVCACPERPPDPRLAVLKDLAARLSR